MAKYKIEAEETRAAGPKPSSASSAAPREPREKRPDGAAAKGWESVQGSGFRDAVAAKGATPGPSNPIPGAFLEPLVRSWSHFVGIYRQNLSKSSKIDF